VRLPGYSVIQAIDGARTFTSLDSQHCRLLLSRRTNIPNTALVLGLFYSTERERQVEKRFETVASKRRKRRPAPIGGHVGDPELILLIGREKRSSVESRHASRSASQLPRTCQQAVWRRMLRLPAFCRILHRSGKSSSQYSPGRRSGRAFNSMPRN